LAKTDIAGLYRSYGKSFLKHLHSAEKLDDEVIHDLRLDVKRLRSVLRLLDYLGQEKKPGKKTLKLLNPVFKKAGSLRNISLNLKQCRSYDNKLIKGFREYLKDKENKMEEKFTEKVKEFKDKRLRKATSHMVESLKKLKTDDVIESSDTYIGKLLKRIRILNRQMKNDESFHEVRKKLKDIKAVKQLEEELGVKNGTGEAKKIKLLEQKIGRWHDRIIFMEETEKYLAENKKSDKPLAKLIMDIKTENEKIKVQISKQLQAFIAANLSAAK
jgi:CHAD domain-containing protein